VKTTTTTPPPKKKKPSMTRKKCLQRNTGIPAHTCPEARTVINGVHCRYMESNFKKYLLPIS
jgi:5-methylcytosine-specific restriction endonuclease McrA